MSVEVKTPTRTQFEHSEFPCGEKTSNNFNEENAPETNVAIGRSVKFDVGCVSENKNDSQRNFPSFHTRKRKPSVGKYDYPYHQGSYRRKRVKSTPAESNIVLPTRFLLGGNINDPLNLNSLNDEEVDRLLNEKTPQSSPVPLPAHRRNVEVTIPCNINDPLNLDISDDSLHCKKKKRNKHKKKLDESQTSTFSAQGGRESLSEKRKGLMEALKIEVDEFAPPVTSQNALQSPKDLSIDFSKALKPDKIVSPVIPQVSPRSRRRRRTFSMSDVRPEGTSTVARSILRTSLSPPRNSAIDFDIVTPPKRIKRQISQKPAEPVKNQKKSKFIHGNYCRYYGYRNPNAEEDHRLQSLKKIWFEGKDVLDIGCNVGHLTLAVAKDFNPRKIIGIDIDGKLISAARKNVRHYVTNQKNETNKFPVSNVLSYGPICAPPLAEDPSYQHFPKNVAFIQGNYVLENDSLLELQKEEYDVILALSLTKWIHLNSGDAGLKRFFKRVFKHLRPGGKLVLEPQPWSSYKKRKKLTEEIFSNFQSIQMKPAHFSDYLLSREVGFSTCEVVDVPFNKSKGFRRPIQLFTKAETTQNSPKQDTVTPSGTPGRDLDHTGTNIDEGKISRVCNVGNTVSDCQTSGTNGTEIETKSAVKSPSSLQDSLDKDDSDNVFNKLESTDSADQVHIGHNMEKGANI